MSAFKTHLFVNYILSTLKFTYPTVFQGWQTLVASLFLLVMKRYAKENVMYSGHPGYGIINLLPNLIFHVFAIIAGSKALSHVSVPIFLGVSNVTNVAVQLSNLTLTRFQVISGCITVITSIALLVSRHKNVADISNVWLITYVFFMTVDALYSAFINLKITRMKKLWYTNCFSVMVLAPASLYLQEAFSALEFALANKLKFYASVIISGVCGGMAQVLSINIENSSSQICAVTCAAILSQFVFQDDALAGTVFLILVINLISHTILCLPIKPTDKTPIDMAVV